MTAVVLPIFESAAVAWPLIAWGLLARTKPVGAGVGIVLLLVSAFGSGLVLAGLHGWRIYAALPYAVTCVLIIFIGVGLERGRLTTGRPSLSVRRTTGYVVFALAGLVGVLIVTPVLAVIAVFSPNGTHVLPLAETFSTQQVASGCGSDTCTKVYSVTATGQTPDQVETQLRTFLTTSRGWSLNSLGSGCQQTGLFDSETDCVSVTRSSGGVLLSVSRTSQWS